VIGAGKIGATVAGLLASTGDYQVTLADRSPEVIGNLDRDERIRIMAADAEDSLKLVDLLNGQFAVLNAAPLSLTKHIAEAARAAGTHYLDLTEDVVSTRRVRELAANANTAFIPQCGLAPGFVSIVAFDMAKGFEMLDSVRLRVGALPDWRFLHRGNDRVILQRNHRAEHEWLRVAQRVHIEQWGRIKRRRWCHQSVDPTLLKRTAVQRTVQLTKQRQQKHPY
jgi:saccharopine dehydrogenase-like NADP-dependent oxidoreductase